ncbi:MAG TPA: phenylacetate--CoA ligase [Caulobacteraceae bacterium]|nr:phenylacetate--CoA ligase [Caulobacteraceae bacterium]
MSQAGDLSALQAERLRASLARACSLPWYLTRCRAAGIAPESIAGPDDLPRLPFMLKTDFREHYPFGMFAAPREEIVRLHASSGTSGKPTIVAYTQDDLDVWAELMARSLAAAGARKGDILHNAFGYGLFTGGLGVHDGAQRLGLAVLPVSGGQSERQVQLILDLKPRIICCTPSYMLALAEAVERAGVDPRDTSLEIGIHGAEPWSEAMRGEIERRWGITALDLYGLSEVIGPGVAQECADARGPLTIWEDHFLAEIVDPATGAPATEGDVGELVLTSLTKQATPVIRYRTGDLTRLHPPAAPWPFRRMERVLGRCDDMLIIRGVNLFPRQIEELVLETPGLAAHYRIDIAREGAMDTLTITVEGASQAAGLALGRRIKDRLGLSAAVVVIESGALPRSEGKARRVFDHRG